MAKNNPPDGWTASSGTWGTDLDHDIPAAPQAIPIVGDSSIKFINTGSPSAIRGSLIPAEPNIPYRLRAIIQADSTTGSHTIKVAVNQYDNVRAFVSQAGLVAAAVATVNTWEIREGLFTTASTTAFMDIEVLKVSAAFNAWLDYASLMRAPTMFEAYQAGALSQATGATKVPFDTQSYDHGAIWDAGNTRFVAPWSGKWNFDGGVTFAAITDAKFVEVSLYVTPVLGIAAIARRLDRKHAGVTGQITAAGNSTLNLNAGEFVELYTDHDDSNPEVLTIGQVNTWFTGHEIR